MRSGQLGLHRMEKPTRFSWTKASEKWNCCEAVRCCSHIGWRSGAIRPARKHGRATTAHPKAFTFSIGGILGASFTARFTFLIRPFQIRPAREVLVSQPVE